MSLIDDLLEAINIYYQEHGHYPQVEISQPFFDDHAWDIDKLSKDGISVRVVDKLYFRSFNLIGATKGQNIDTLHELKKLVDKMVSEGKGHWPVRGIPPDAKVFLPIHLYPIIPGDDPAEHDLENEITAGHPESEYIRIIMGDIDGNLRG